MLRHCRHPLTIPLAFLALAGSVGVGYVVVHARTETSVAATAHVPVVCCDGGEETGDPVYVSEEEVFYRGGGVL